MDDTSAQQPSTTDDTGRYAYAGLDRALHERARLGLLMALAASPDGWLFTDLKRLCELTDGNLNRHVHTLEKAGLAEVWKKQSAAKSQTLVKITAEGRTRFRRYLGELERVVRDGRGIGLDPAAE